MPLKKIIKIFTLCLIILIIIGGVGYFIAQKYFIWPTFSSNYGFEFKYPLNWQYDNRYFSPDKIEYTDIGSVIAPVYYDLILVNKFSTSNINYQISNDKRNNPDSTVEINNKIFKKYDLIDYGRYEGESAGKVTIYVSPEIRIEGDNYYLIFHWEEKPGGKTLSGNSYSIFEEIIRSLKLKEPNNSLN